MRRTRAARLVCGFYLRFLSQTCVACSFLLIAQIMAPRLIAQMKLIAPESGWLEHSGKLYWTSDGGGHWAEITPNTAAPPGGRVALRNVFFRDTSEGWASIAVVQRVPAANARDNPAAVTGKTSFLIAHTENSGQSWSYRPLTYPALPQFIEDDLAGIADLYFTDSLHGWADLSLEGNYRGGRLLHTDDGGASWQWVASPPHSGPLLFSSLNDGWLISNWGADQLYVTHDGAQTWSELRLRRPAMTGAAYSPTYPALPTFTDAKHGFLPVKYSGAQEIQSYLVIFGTEDGGRHWDEVKTFPEPSGEAGVEGFPFSIQGSAIFVPAGSAKGGPKMQRIQLLDGKPVAFRPTALSSTHLSFADSRHGWKWTNGVVAATADGGATWSEISTPKNDVT